MRSNSYVVASALRQWRQVYTIYQNRYTFAIQHHQAHVQYNAIVMWRIQLRTKLKLLKHARMVEKFFVQRRILKSWRCKLEMKKRSEKLRTLETQKLQVYMTGMNFYCCTYLISHTLSLAWKRKAIRRQSLRMAEQQITERVITVGDFSLESSDIHFTLNSAIDGECIESVDKSCHRDQIEGARSGSKAFACFDDVRRAPASAYCY